MLDSPVLIMGMHNSGTSILAEVINDLGVFIQNNMEHFESRFFSLLVNDFVLGKQTGWSQLPIMPIEEVLERGKHQVPLILNHWRVSYAEWGYDGNRPWGFKDPRLCILLPLYLKIWPKARIIHILRSPTDIADSLVGKSKEGAGTIEDRSFWVKLTNQYNGRVNDLMVDNPNYFRVHYESLCSNPVGSITKINDFLGANKDQNEISEISKKVRQGVLL